MKIKAKQWVKYKGEWHQAGDEFKIFKDDAEEMKQYGEVIEENEEELPEVVEKEEVRRTRKRKAEE